MNRWSVHRAVLALRQGGLIAYPTEAVWGLGCDPANPEALTRLLQLKRRPWHKGLILIASHWTQLQAWVASPQPPASAAQDWPGHVTYLLPAAAHVPALLRGRHRTLAVRVSAHPGVRQLCDAFGGALVSTSANRHGHPTGRNLTQLRHQLGPEVDYYLNGKLGNAGRASRIIDPVSGRTLRA